MLLLIFLLWDTPLLYCITVSTTHLHFHGFSFSKTTYLCKGQCWRSDPSWCSAGNYGSVLYVPPMTFFVCSSAHSSYTCVVCQLKVKTFEGEHINFIHCYRQKEWVASNEITQPAAVYRRCVVVNTVSVVQTNQKRASEIMDVPLLVWGFHTTVARHKGKLWAKKIVAPWSLHFITLWSLKHKANSHCWVMSE